MMIESIDISHIRDLLKRDDRQELLAQLADAPVQDIARLIKELDPDHRILMFRTLPREHTAAVFSYLSPEQEGALLQELSDDEIRAILGELTPDDRTMLLQDLPDEVSQRLISMLAPVDREQSRALLAYPEDSVGRLMTPHFVTLRPDWSVRYATEHVRAESKRGETVDILFVTDERGILRGVIGLKQLILHEDDSPVSDLLDGPVHNLMAGTDQEEAGRMMQHYDLSVAPVTDPQGVLLGIVTIDDVMDVIEKETTEDFHKMGSVGVLNFGLREARPSLLYRKRVGWLVMLVFMNVFGGAAIAYYEATIEAVIALVFFLPLIVDSGGNAGAQSATLMVRALATGDVRTRDWFRLLGKEAGVALALGITMGLAVWGLGIWRGGAEVGMVVALSMVCVVVIGSLIGMLLPFMLTRANLDPATASAPLITSIADIAGILIYFSIATAILTLPPA